MKVLTAVQPPHTFIFVAIGSRSPTKPREIGLWFRSSGFGLFALYLIYVTQVGYAPIIRLRPWPFVEGSKLRANVFMKTRKLAFEPAQRLGQLRIRKCRLATLALVKNCSHGLE